MSKKKPWTLKEKKGVRIVKLHHHRFARFVRFLRDADIEIKYIKEDGDRIIYAGEGKDSQSSVLDLVVDVLGVSEDTAKQYFEDKLGTDDTHSVNKDKILADGNIIEGINPYFESDAPIDRRPPRYSRYNYFFGRDRDRKMGVISMFETFREELEQLSQLVLNKFDEYWKKDKITSEDLPNYQWPFSEDISRVQEYAEENFKAGTTQLEIMVNVLENYFRAYKKLANRPTKSGLKALPTYDTYHRAHQERFAKMLLEENRQKIRKLLDKQRQPEFIELLEHRYEILWFIKEQKLEFKKLNMTVLGLYYVATIEFEAAKELVERIVSNLLEDLRFMIYGMDNGVAPVFQKDSLSLDDLSQILIRYIFRKGLRKSIDIDAINILNDRLLMLPENHAGRGNYKSEVIYEFFRKSFSEKFYNKLTYDFGLGNPSSEM